MSIFAATEYDGQLDLVLFRQEIASMLRFEIDVMVTDFRTQADLFEFDLVDFIVLMLLIICLR